METLFLLIASVIIPPQVGEWKEFNQTVRGF